MASIANQVALQIAYKKYTDANIVAGVEPDPTVDPAVTGGQQLRRVGTTLSPVKGSFQSAEIRPDQQIVDLRQGMIKPAGDISVELSPLTFQDFFGAVVRGSWVAGVSHDNTVFTNITAVNATSKLTVGASTWVAQGFRVGDIVRLAAVAAPNLGVNFTITALSGVDATVYPAPTDMGADSAFTVSVVGKKTMAPQVPIKTKWAIEHYYSDSDLSHLFTECRIGSFKVAMPSQGICTGSIGIVGRNMLTYDTGASPFFAAAAAPTTTSLLASFGGAILLAGVPVGVITQADMTIDVQASTLDAAFNTVSPEIFTGVLKVTGTVQALFQDNTLLNYFLQETSLSMIMTLTTQNANNADFVSFFMPKVKLSSANFANSGNQGVPMTLGFQALENDVTTGYDQSTIVIQDSLAA